MHDHYRTIKLSSMKRSWQILAIKH